MKRNIFKLVLLLVFSVSLFSTIVVRESGPYYAGESIGFNKTCHEGGNRDDSWWDWGDGSSYTMHLNDADYGWQYHTYSKPGTYTITYTRGAPFSTPWCFPSTETYSITIEENRYITASPENPLAGQVIIFTAYNFQTPENIRWDMGDGTILNVNNSVAKNNARILGGNIVQYTYNVSGNYTVNAYDENGNQKIPISLSVIVGQPNRKIVFSPETNVRVDQPVYFGVTGFLTGVIDWNFGDGTLSPADGITVMHRFQTAGTWIVTAKDSTIDHTPEQEQILILPENRYIEAASPEVMVNKPIQISAKYFRGDLVLWDFGDGKQESAGHTVSHVYERGGTYTIKARDENGESHKEFYAKIIVRSINDEVHLEVAELRLDNGKYYKIVPKNSKEIKAILRMKMRGTGLVSGYWIVDGNNFGFFNELAIQGELKEISTGTIPGLPTLDPGIHTVSVKLTRPSGVALNFPVLKYFVLPSETIMETIGPKDGFVVKEKDIPVFSWKEPKGASKYKLGLSNYLYPLLMNEKTVTWVDTGSELSFKPSKQVWDKILRNKWTHWKIRAFDTNKQFIAESEIKDIKVVIATAEVSINSITDLNGKEVKIKNGIVRSSKKNLLVNGDIIYKGDSKFIVLRVYSGDELIDQLLFRDVKKDEVRGFNSSIPNLKDNTKIKFEVLKTSSPSVIIGIKGLILRKK